MASVQPQADDRHKALAAELDREFPESWIPNDAGDSIVGEFQRLDVGPTAYGPASIAVLRTREGREQGVWLLATALKSQFARARPTAGELVGVRYLGKRKGASGHEYQDFRVVVDRPNAETSWDQVAAEADAELSGEMQQAERSRDDAGIPF